jgi:hypothetical protein
MHIGVVFITYWLLLPTDSETSAVWKPQVNHLSASAALHTEVQSPSSQVEKYRPRKTAVAALDHDTQRQRPSLENAAITSSIHTGMIPCSTTPESESTEPGLI